MLNANSDKPNPIMPGGRPRFRVRSGPSGVHLFDRATGLNVLLDELQRLKHMANALAGEVLEIAGLENLHDAVLNVLGKPLLVAALGRGR